MTRWLVSFDDAIFEAATPQAAVEKAVASGDYGDPLDSTFYAVDLDAIAGTDRCVRMRVGAVEIPEEAKADG